jgi:hypothetical protein
MTPTLSLLLLGTAAALSACSDDTPADGDIAAVVYGEDYIEEMIPSELFADGWTVSYSKFLVSLGALRAQAGHDTEEIGTTDYKIYDLSLPSNGEGFAIGTFAAAGGTYDHFGYQIRPDPTATAGNADAEDIATFQAAGYSLWLVGTATKGAETRTFDWGFTMKLEYSHCAGEEPAVLDGGTLAVQATIHGDHVFYDDLTSPEPNMAFQLVADADGKDGTAPDGSITAAELTATDIRTQQRYQVGSTTDLAGAEIVNLHQFIQHQVTTVGHFNGEGHCEHIGATE